MNKDFKRLTFIDSIWGFIYYIAAPFLTIYFKDIGGLETVGISVAILLIIKGVVSLLSIKLLNKKSMKKIFLFSQIAEGIRIFAFIFANNITTIFIIQFFGGITGGLIIPSYGKIFVKSGEDENDDAFKQKTGIVNITMGIGAILSGFIVSYLGYIPIFLSWGAIEIIYGIYIYFKV